MLSDKIDYLFKIIGAGNNEIAQLAQCDASSISRLRSGKRNAAEGSRIIGKFIDGVYLYCQQNNNLGSLAVLLDISTSDSESIKKGLAVWLYDGQDPPSINSAKEQKEEFGRRLDSVMLISGISNSRLSKLMNIDPSYISRIRKGSRMMKKNSQVTLKLCSIIAEKLRENNKLPEFSEISGIPPELITDAALPEMISDWLYDFDVTAQVFAVKRIVKNIGQFSGSEGTVLPPVSEILNSYPEVQNKDSYLGKDGLRMAAVRFLNRVIGSGCGEVFLYSDREMDWMCGEYKKVWSGLMHYCLRKKVRITIIHNIDRSVPEMLNAIGSWMPLYASGLIEPYYSSKRSGDVFSHTLFLAPDTVCVEGCGIRSCEEYTTYRYVTDKAEMQSCMMSYKAFLNDSRRLLKASREPIPLLGSYTIFECSGLRICIGENDVIINKATAPTVGFKITHPALKRSFEEYVKTLGTTD